MIDSIKYLLGVVRCFNEGNREFSNRTIYGLYGIMDAFNDVEDYRKRQFPIQTILKKLSFPLGLLS